MSFYEQFQGSTSLEAISSALNSDYGNDSEHITAKTAMQIAALFCAVRVISEGLAALPLNIYEPRKKGGKKKAKTHPVYKLLRYAPNEWMTSFDFIQYMTLTAMLNGNAFALINRHNGIIKELIPLDHDCVTVKKSYDHSIYYEYRGVFGNIITYSKYQIFHLSGISMDGLKGLSLVKTAMNSLGLSKSLEKAQKHFHKKQLRLDGILSTEGELNTTQKDKISDEFDKKFQAGGDGGIALLDKGYKFQSFSMTAKDAQQIENREYAVSEVARFTGVFPILLMKSGDTNTFASSQEFFLQHIKITLMPWFRRWEQRIKLDLLGLDNEFYAKFNVTALLAGDAKARAEFYRAGIESGHLTRNEARVLEERNPIEGLDDPIMPLNFEAVKSKKKKKKKKKRKNKEKSVKNKELEHVS